MVHSGYVTYAGDTDVLYNKFNVEYEGTRPSPPHNPPLDPNFYTRCVIARTDWQVVKCSEGTRHVVCQQGFTPQTT